MAMHGLNRDLALRHWEQKLTNRVPAGAVPDLARWIVDLRVEFVISRPRASKLGDFRPAFNGKPARISVNRDLNPYSFLITTVHEFAHLGCHLLHGHSVSPHGKEWKQIYRELLEPLSRGTLLPVDLKQALAQHLARPSASSCSCSILSAALARYDDNPGTILGQLKPGAIFKFRGHSYQVTGKRRTRILCRRLPGEQIFLISQRAQVDHLDNG